MIILGVIIAILCFLYLSLLALLRVARERRKQQSSVFAKLPLVGRPIIDTWAAEINKIQNSHGLTNAGLDWIAELRAEQPFLFLLLTEFLKQSPGNDLREMAPVIVIYKLLKAQMEADLLDQSLDPPTKPH